MPFTTYKIKRLQTILLAKHVYLYQIRTGLYSQKVQNNKPPPDE